MLRRGSLLLLVLTARCMQLPNPSEHFQLKLPQVRMPELHPDLKRLAQGLKREGGAGRIAGGDNPAAFVTELTGVDGWELKHEKDGVRVWRRSVAGSPFGEIRGNGIVDAPPAKMLALLQSGDAEVIRQYNPMYDEGEDLQQLDAKTKISYGTARPIFPFKPRDTVTRVAFRELGGAAGGGTVLMLRAVDHAAKPASSDYVRAKILRGMHLVQPVEGSPGKTNFTFTQQINTGGVIPAWLINVLITQDAVQFVKRIGAVAKKGVK